MKCIGKHQTNIKCDLDTLNCTASYADSVGYILAKIQENIAS